MGGLNCGKTIWMTHLRAAQTSSRVKLLSGLWAHAAHTGFLPPPWSDTVWKWSANWWGIACTPLFPDTLGSTDRGCVSSVGRHPGGIISPICPRISSSSQSEMEIFAAPLPLGSWSCSHGAFSFFFSFWSTVSCAHKSVTTIYRFLSHFQQVFLSLHKADGKLQKFVFVFLFACDYLLSDPPCVCSVPVPRQQCILRTLCEHLRVCFFFVFFFYLCGL